MQRLVEIHKDLMRTDLIKSKAEGVQKELESLFGKESIKNIQHKGTESLIELKLTWKIECSEYQLDTLFGIRLGEVGIKKWEQDFSNLFPSSWKAFIQRMKEASWAEKEGWIERKRQHFHRECSTCGEPQFDVYWGIFRRLGDEIIAFTEEEKYSVSCDCDNDC